MFLWSFQYIWRYQHDGQLTYFTIQNIEGYIRPVTIPIIAQRNILDSQYTYYQRILFIQCATASYVHAMLSIGHAWPQFWTISTSNTLKNKVTSVCVLSLILAHTSSILHNFYFGISGVTKPTLKTFDRVFLTTLGELKSLFTRFYRKVQLHLNLNMALFCRIQC